MIYLIIAIWIICGILAYGIMFAHLQYGVYSQDYKWDMAFSMLIGLAGPIGLLFVLFIAGGIEDGLKFK